MTAWGDLNTRARGLGTHLLSRADLHELASASDLGTLADHFARAGLPPGDPARGPASFLELAVRRDTGLRLATLARWAGPRTATLAVIFEDEDRRSLRAIVRGALQGAPMDARLAALIPTPSLPQRALEALASLDTPAEIAALLMAWGNAYGAAILEATQSHPDPVRLETAVNRTFAARALAESRRVPMLRGHVRRVIDLENVRAAIGGGARGDDAPLDLWFLDGGNLSPEVYLRAAGAGAPRLVAERLADALRRTIYAAVLTRHAADPASLEGPLLAAQLAEVERMRHVDPTSPAPLLAYALRLRIQALDLRTIIWGIALRAPGSSIVSGLVAP